MTLLRVVIASRRRLLAEALALALTETFTGRLEATITPAAAIPPDASILVVDLDDPGLESGELAALAARSWVRRAGFFDSFDAVRAARAFELGLTVLTPLSRDSTALARAVLAQQVDTMMAATGITAEQLQRVQSLSSREREVLGRLGAGDSATVVAHLLGLSPHTVHAHRRRIFRKLDVQSSAAAVALAEAAGAL